MTTIIIQVMNEFNRANVAFIHLCFIHSFLLLFTEIGENETWGSDIFRNNTSTTPAPTIGSTVFRTQSFANAVALSYSSAAASNLGSNNGSNKGHEDSLSKKQSSDSSEHLNGTAPNNMKLDSFIHPDPYGCFNLFPSSSKCLVCIFIVH